MSLFWNHETPDLYAKQAEQREAQQLASASVEHKDLFWLNQWVRLWTMPGVSDHIAQSDSQQQVASLMEKEWYKYADQEWAKIAHATEINPFAKDKDYQWEMAA